MQLKIGKSLSKYFIDLPKKPNSLNKLSKITLSQIFEKIKYFEMILDSSFKLILAIKI